MERNSIVIKVLKEKKTSIEEELIDINKALETLLAEIINEGNTEEKRGKKRSGTKWTVFVKNKLKSNPNGYSIGQLYDLSVKEGIKGPNPYWIRNNITSTLVRMIKTKQAKKDNEGKYFLARSLKKEPPEPKKAANQ